MKKLLIAFVVLVALFILGGLMLPSTYEVYRETTIKAPAEVIFSYLDDLTKHDDWAPWKAKDPSIKSTLGPITSGKGASMSWTSDNGEGSMTITESVPHKHLVTVLDFGQHGKPIGEYHLNESADGVLVRWTMKGESGGIVARYFGLLMDKMVGPDFEQGLANLKRVSEAAPPPAPKEEPATETATPAAEAEAAAPAAQ